LQFVAATFARYSLSYKAMTGTTTDEVSLLAELRLGSHAAFRCAVARYSGAMLATARAIAGSAHAEDIVQEAWLTVFRQIDSFEGRASFSTWLQRIVMNRAITVLRKSRREASVDLPHNADIPADWYTADGHWAKPPPAWHTSSPDELLTADELQACLDKHLASMPEAQRAVLVMRDMQGLSFDDICELLQLSAANARVLVHRGRLRLMAMVNHFEETGTC
jgi:RNA polymerase sigma-70 factor (ECF subfamily)